MEVQCWRLCVVSVKWWQQLESAVIVAWGHHLSSWWPHRHVQQIIVDGGAEAWHADVVWGKMWYSFKRFKDLNLLLASSLAQRFWPFQRLLLRIVMYDQPIVKQQPTTTATSKQHWCPSTSKFIYTIILPIQYIPTLHHRPHIIDVKRHRDQQLTSVLFLIFETMGKKVFLSLQ